MSAIIQFIANHNENFYIHRVEKALGFKLYDWQKEYIFHNGCIPNGGRNTGKSIAVITKFLLDYKAKPINIGKQYYSLTHNKAQRDESILTDDPDFNKINSRVFKEQILNTYYLLKKSKLKLRRIVLG